MENNSLRFTGNHQERLDQGRSHKIFLVKSRRGQIFGDKRQYNLVCMPASWGLVFDTVLSSSCCIERHYPGLPQAAVQEAKSDLPSLFPICPITHTVQCLQARELACADNHPNVSRGVSLFNTEEGKK